MPKDVNRGLNVLVIGAGMYVCGRGTEGYGTVLPTLFQAQSDLGLFSSITVCATSSTSVKHLSAKVKSLEAEFGISIPLKAFPQKGSDPKAYLKAMKHEQFDCALIVVPDDHHRKIAEKVMQAGIHVLLVKPFVSNMKDAVALVDLAKEKKLYTTVEFHKRYDFANIKMRDAIAEGKVGEPLYFHIEYSQRKSIPEFFFSKWVRTTNIFQYLGVHYVDLIYFLTGALPIRVMALGQKNWLKKKGIDTYDAIEVMIEWQKGKTKFSSTHLTNWIDPNSTSAMSDQKIKLIGTEGRIEAEQKHRGIQMVTDKDGIEDFNPYFSQLYGDVEGKYKRFAGYGYEGFLTFFKDVGQIIAGERSIASFEGLRPTFISSLVSTAVIEAANQSLKKGNQWIAVDRGLLRRYI